MLLLCPIAREKIAGFVIMEIDSIRIVENFVIELFIIK